MSEGKRQQRMLIVIVSEMKRLLEYNTHYKRISFLQSYLGPDKALRKIPYLKVNYKFSLRRLETSCQIFSESQIHLRKVRMKKSKLGKN